MGFVQVQTWDEMMNNRATFGTVESLLSCQLTWFQVWVAKNCKHSLGKGTSIPGEVLKLAMTVYVSLSEKSLLDMDVSEEQRKIKTRHLMSWFGHSAQERDVSVSSEVVEMSSHQGSAHFNHSTVIYVCVPEELTLWALSLHRPAFEAGWYQGHCYYFLCSRNIKTPKATRLGEKK